MWKGSEPKFVIAGEFSAGPGEVIRMISASEGTCFQSGFYTASLNNYDSFNGRVYVGPDGYWYVSTVGSAYARGQTLFATCIRS